MGAARAEGGDSTQAQAPSENEELSKVKGQVEGLNESYIETKNTVDALSKLKVGGYIQTQFQYADTEGVASKAGGDFKPNTNQRINIRRARLKTTYTGLTSKYVLEFDMLPSGISIKDAYAAVMEPWLKTFSAQAGVMDRPFGWEVPVSSSSIDAPERTRFEQTYFPGEKDLGVELIAEPGSDMGILQYFNLRGGVFTGMGGLTLAGSNPPGQYDEIDNEFDYIGRIGFKAPFNDINLAIDGGFSMYLGKSTSVNDTSFTWGDTGFVATNGGNLLQTFDRNIMGVDAQLYYDLPVVGGFSLKGEYEWGKVATPKNSNSLYNPTSLAAPHGASGPIEERNVMGWYLMGTQNLTKWFQAVARYDFFDPNTDAEDADIKLGSSNTSAADLAYGTLGFGLHFYWDSNTRLTAYYDMPMNEKAPETAATLKTVFSNTLTPITKDIPDNVFTLRLQVKF
ncbi:MAG: hypothetical protein JF616_19780 [Fibrobacteres bacterium]|nr:hypothetical protein [Fibrobacterota bacterium]